MVPSPECPLLFFAAVAKVGRSILAIAHSPANFARACFALRVAKCLSGLAISFGAPKGVPVGRAKWLDFARRPMRKQRFLPAGYAAWRAKWIEFMAIDFRSERAFGVCRVGRDRFYPGEVRIAHNSPPGLCAARHPGEGFWSAHSGSADWLAAAADSRQRRIQLSKSVFIRQFRMVYG